MGMAQRKPMMIMTMMIGCLNLSVLLKVDYDSLTNVAPVAETQDQEEEPEEEDPFSVNVVQRKKRRSKPKRGRIRARTRRG